MLRVVACVLAILVLLPLAQAAEQPKEVPSDLQNGQDTRFGRIAMEPYVRAGGGPVPVEAHVLLRDLRALEKAETLMLALNLHSKDADIAIDGAFAADGSAIPALRTETTDLQAQLFLSASEVASRAVDGAVELTFKGHAAARHDGQVHVGTLVVAYASDWSPVLSSDGPAQLYGYSLLQAKGAGGGLMPFHGQGNSLLALPLAILSVLVLLAGGMAVEVLRAGAGLPVPAPMAMPVSLSAAAPRPPLAVPSNIPVFGSPVSPTVGRAAPAPVVATPIQGPALPPHWASRPPAGAPPAVPVPAPATPTPARPASAAPSMPLPLRVPVVPAPATVRPALSAAPARKTHVAVRRPKRPASKPRPASAAPRGQASR